MGSCVEEGLQQTRIWFFYSVFSSSSQAEKLTETWRPSRPARELQCLLPSLKTINQGKENLFTRVTTVRCTCRSLVIGGKNYQNITNMGLMGIFSIYRLLISE